MRFPHMRFSRYVLTLALVYVTVPCVAQAQWEPGGGLIAPVYGMAAAPATRGDVDDILRTYCGVLYRI